MSMRTTKDGRAGKRPGAGRKPGTPSEPTKDLRAMILGALEAMDGQAYLEKVAKEDPRTFCSLLGRVLPITCENTNTNYVISDKPMTTEEWEAAYCTPAAGSTHTH
jgi:hypothetical protein